MKCFGDRKTVSHGQALVEAALFFPILLILVAGLVEMSQLVITQNRITEAARASARFGARGGQDLGLLNTAINSLTYTLAIDETSLDMWTIRATINDAGTDYSNWEFTHIYGISNTIKSSELNESLIKQNVLAELQRDHTGTRSTAIAGDMEMVGVYLIHDVESILGLDAIPALEGLNSVTELSVVRISGQMVEQTNGCSAFPISIHQGIRSVTPTGEGASPYPESSEFDYPTPPPNYEDYYHHEPNIPLDEAKEGYIYRIHNGFGSGNFGWLHWNNGRPANANTLADSLSWPGDSNDYTDHGDNQSHPAADAYPYIVRGYVEPGDATDISLHVGDWVAANTGSVNANGVRNAIESLINNKSAVRAIIWDEAQQQGNNGQYKVAGFAIFRLLGYSLNQGQGGSWILAEFIRLDSSCGQLAN